MDDMKKAVEQAIKRWKDFDGRSSRSEFWWVILACFLVGILIEIIGTVLPGLATLLSLVFFLATIVPLTALGIRRIHDSNNSGFWVIAFFIPLVNLVAILYFGLQKSTEGENQYGKLSA